MSRVSDLENKVDALERNVGMLAKEAGLDDCLMISDFSSISKYKDGIESGCAPVKNDKGAFNIRATKIALVINKTAIHDFRAGEKVTIVIETKRTGELKSLTVTKGE